MKAPHDVHSIHILPDVIFRFDEQLFFFQMILLVKSSPLNTGGNGWTFSQKNLYKGKKLALKTIW
jgi:hypothetical protein